MGFKGNDRCLDKAAPDEPIFVLRAQDMHAPQVIRYWLSLASRTLTPEHRDEAQNHLAVMEQWQREHYEQVKEPD